MADEPEQPLSGKDTRKKAKIDLAAAKARAKAEKPFWKKWWFILGAIILVIAIASSAGTGDKNDTTGDTNSSSGGDGDSAGIGDAVADGDFTFNVSDLNCGEKKIGSGPFASEASGEYCIAEVTVENTGNESQLMDGSNQFLYIGDKQYSADSDAIFADKRAEAFFIEEINPGLSVDGIVVWDVPVGSEPDRLEFHDSLFSGGVEVNL